MPTEALENLMLDAIEDELAKIGTSPTSDWRTAPKPTIKTGVPGDPIGGPNKCTLYLQHVTSEFGQANVPLSLHRLDCDFDIWCVSSHPVDARKRAYDLAADVSQALRRADRTFYELFQYGLEIGELEFRGDDLFTRAGIYAVVQRVRMSANRSHEDDMNETKVRELIEEYIKKKEWFHWLHTAPYTSSFNGVPYYGKRAIQSPSPAVKVRGACFFLDTTTGVNGIWEAGLGFNSIIPISSGLPGFSSVWGNPFYFAMRQNRMNPTGVTAGDRLQGIGWGDLMGVDTPWASTFGTSSANQTVQLRYNLTREKWELMYFIADGNPPVVVDCSIQTPVFTVDQSIPELALEYLVNSDGSNPVLKAYLDRKLIHTLNLPSVWAVTPTVEGVGPYIFATNGSGAGAFVSEAGFYEGVIYNPLPVTA